MAARVAPSAALHRLLLDESGASLVEYALVAALISIASFAALSAIGTQVSNLFKNAAKAL